LRGIFHQGNFSADTGVHDFQDKVVFDIGTRDGRHVKLFRDYGAKEVYGIDPDSAELRKAVESGLLDEAHALPIRLEALPDHLKGTCDIATVLDLNPDLAQNEAFFRSLGDTISPSGKVFMTIAETKTAQHALPLMKQYFYTQIRQLWKIKPDHERGEDPNYPHTYAIVARPKGMREQGVRQPAKPTYQEWDSKLKNLCLDLQDSEIPDTLMSQE
jgi:hypothetical protein